MKLEKRGTPVFHGMSFKKRKIFSLPSVFWNKSWLPSRKQRRKVTMIATISFLVLSTLPQLVVPAVTSYGALAELMSGHSRIFPGEHFQLKCTIPDGNKSTWNYLWFNGPKQLACQTQMLKVSPKHSGAFQCRGVRDSAVGNLYTLKSEPVEINVDGGWAILHVPQIVGLVGETLNMTCRLRGHPRPHEVILYKGGVEVMRRSGLNPKLSLPLLSTADQGPYSCRASWDNYRQTHSVVSVDVQVDVLEVLTQPVLEVVADDNLLPPDQMQLTCRVQYNARAPAPPIHYYFYKGDKRLGLARSENFHMVKRKPGLYSCKAKVLELDLSKRSEAEAVKV
ncbi:high affinity immunoglobulin gamma Fc receptor I-like [Vanacampus margaritifer]